MAAFIALPHPEGYNFYIRPELVASVIPMADNPERECWVKMLADPDADAPGYAVNAPADVVAALLGGAE